MSVRHYEEHVLLVRSLAAQDADAAVRLMAAHLAHVQANRELESTAPSNDIAMALT